jgi:hypothetical protein
MKVARVLAVMALATSFSLAATMAHADTPLGPANHVSCPGTTGDFSKYRGALMPYRCHSAVIDPLGRTVILRQGQSGPEGSGGFGWLHAQQDHNLDYEAIERVISSSNPLEVGRGDKRRSRYIADYRVAGNDMISIWVIVDRKPSNAAPDGEPLGVVTAFCKYPAKGDPENRCPDWVDETM